MLAGCLPLLMAGGCAKHLVRRGLMLNAANTAYATRSPGAASTTKRYTYSLWVKRGALGDNARMLRHDDGGGTAYMALYFDSSDRLVWFARNGSSATILELVSTRVYRDPTAWLHITVALDTDQGTSSNRAKVYVNGEQLTAFDTATYPGSGVAVGGLGSGQTITIGRNGTAATPYMDGNLAEIHAVDDLQLDGGYFGRVDPRSGAWAPRRYGGAFGTNGFYLPFIGDAGDAPASASEGVKDRSGNGHNFSATNLAASDFTKDTPVNHGAGTDLRGNFATYNPLHKMLNAAGTISEAGLKSTSPSAAYHWRSISSQPLPETGVYIEFTWHSGGSNDGFGICTGKQVDDLNTSPGNNADEWAFNNGDVRHNSSAAFTGLTSWTTAGRVGMLAYKAGKLWLGINGTWFNSGNPAAGTGAVYTGLTGEKFAFTSHAVAGVLTANFGQKAFTHTQPAGFGALVASARPVAAVKKPRIAFQVASDTGANIEAALAVLRASATPYIEIFKRRDSAEGWRWRFSSDASNYLDSSSTAAKAAFPSLSGTTYSGHSLRVGAAYGVLTGTVAHTNGAATTVADGAGSARKVIIIHRESTGGGDWPMYHPELSAGKLITINGASAESTDSSITNVTASGFDIGSAMATGTYRWIAFVETAGMVALLKASGTGNADGPYRPCGFRPGLLAWRRIDSGDNFLVCDAARNPGNAVNNNAWWNLSNAESSAVRFDFTANGVKLRNTAAEQNASGGTYVGIAFSEQIFAQGLCPAQATAR